MAQRQIATNLLGKPVYYGSAADLAAATAVIDAGAEFRLNTGDVYVADGAGGWNQISTGGAGHVYKPNLDAGERNPDSPSNSFVSQSGEWNETRVTGLTETLINNAPTLFGGFIFNTTSAGTLSVRDAAAIGGGSTPKMIPDATRDVKLDGDKYLTGLTVQGSAAGTDVTVRWRNM